MGVPILRGGRVLGVLVVQNRTRAPLHRGGGRGAADHRHGAGRAGRRRRAGRRATSAARRTASACCRPRLEGVALCPRPRHRPGGAARAAASRSAQMVAEDPVRELRAPVDGGRRACTSALDDLLRRAERGRGRRASRRAGEPTACSPRTAAGSRRIAEAIAQRPDRRGARCSRCRTTPGRAWARSPIPICASGCPISTISPTGCCVIWPASGWRPRPLPEKAVLVARNLGPAELLEYDRKRLRAIVLEEGSPTAHVAIVARALDIP